MNDVAVLVALATAPSSAYAELRERPRFWFPLLLVVLSTVAVVYWYYSVVDVDWFKETMFGNNPGLSPEQKAAVMGMMTRTTLLWGSVVSIFLAVPVTLLVTGVVWLVMAKITKLPQGFKHWFTFASWSSLPLVLGNVVAAVLLAIADTAQISPGVTQALSLNELLFHRPMGAPGANLLGSVGIPAFLSWALSVIGVHTWSQRSWLFSVLFVAIPTVLFYGIWATFAFK
jgi:hypothetical protein